MLSLRLCVYLVSVIPIQVMEGVSLVTDEVKNATKMEVSASDINNVEIFRQLLNQETLIRMTLVKKCTRSDERHAYIEAEFIDCRKRSL